MDSDETARLIECLEGVRQRPKMYLYLGNGEIEAAINFLTGFEVAIGAIRSFDRTLEIREQVVKSRGWTWSAIHPAREMVRGGMMPKAVIDELIDIEIEVIQRQAKSGQRQRRRR